MPGLRSRGRHGAGLLGIEGLTLATQESFMNRDEMYDAWLRDIAAMPAEHRRILAYRLRDIGRTTHGIAPLTTADIEQLAQYAERA